MRDVSTSQTGVALVSPRGVWVLRAQANGSREPGPRLIQRGQLVSLACITLELYDPNSTPSAVFLSTLQCFRDISGPSNTAQSPGLCVCSAPGGRS